MKVITTVIAIAPFFTVQAFGATEATSTSKSVPTFGSCQNNYNDCRQKGDSNCFVQFTDCHNCESEYNKCRSSGDPNEAECASELYNCMKKAFPVSSTTTISHKSTLTDHNTPTPYHHTTTVTTTYTHHTTAENHNTTTVRSSYGTTSRHAPVTTGGSRGNHTILPTGTGSMPSSRGNHTILPTGTGSMPTSRGNHTIVPTGTGSSITRPTTSSPPYTADAQKFVAGGTLFILTLGSMLFL